MEKDPINFPKLTQMKFCRFLLGAITKLMLSHFFKVEDFTRPKNIYNLLQKGTDYLKLWYHFLQEIFMDSNNNKFEEFTSFDVPSYLLRRLATKKNETYIEEPKNLFASFRIKKHELTMVQTFSEKVDHEENPENLTNLLDLTKFEKKFYCREFFVYLMKMNICWCVYFEKYRIY